MFHITHIYNIKNIKIVFTCRNLRGELIANFRNIQLLCFVNSKFRFTGNLVGLYGDDKTNSTQNDSSSIDRNIWNEFNFFKDFKINILIDYFYLIKDNKIFYCHFILKYLESFLSP